MLQKRKIDRSYQQEMKRMKTSILSISEIKWQGVGKITSETFKIFYTRGTDNERGVAVKLDQDMGKTVKGYWTLLDFLKISENPLDLYIIQIYPQT